jgi:hypothetical protein
MVTTDAHGSTPQFVADVDGVRFEEVEAVGIVDLAGVDK